jgi:hypothetical protein
MLNSKPKQAYQNNLRSVPFWQPSGQTGWNDDDELGIHFLESLLMTDVQQVG